MTNANIIYNPHDEKNPSYEQPITVYIAGVIDMLTSKDDVGSVDIFGDVVTEQMAKDMQQARRSRAAELLRKYANALDAR